MTLTVSIIESQVFAGLRAWLMDITGLDGVHVVKELSNRVPMPVGNFINMQCIGKKNLGLAVITENDPYGQITTQPKDYSIQVDCYGPDSGDLHTIITSLWKTARTCVFLADYDITPLFCQDAHEQHITNSENQYEERWISELHLQYNPSVAPAQDYAEGASITLIDTTRVYPA